MAYVNELVKPEAKRSFIIKPNNHVYSPDWWTIDHDTGNVLFKIGVNREEPDEITFGYSYRGENYRLEMWDPACDPNHRWNFRGGDPFTMFEWFTEEIAEDLRKAFYAYGWEGMPPERINYLLNKFPEDTNPNRIGMFVAGF